MRQSRAMRNPRRLPDSADDEALGPSVCLVFPCLDEQSAIGEVVRTHRQLLPEADILVVDNGSADATAQRAREAGARVVVESRRGKAIAMQLAFAVVDTDVLIMVDGDGSYPAEGARRLLEEYRRAPAGMITGIRVADEPTQSFRPMHQTGTRAFEYVLALVFGYRSRDIFSGSRLFSREFYKNVPVLSRGFELELELTVQSIDKAFRVSEITIPFTKRTEGGVPKLNGFRDGLRILKILLVLFRDYKPMAFFGAMATVAGLLGLLAGSLPVWEYYQTRIVGRVPLAFLAASLVVISILTAQIGIIIEGTLRYNREAFQIRIRQSTGPRGRG